MSRPARVAPEKSHLAGGHRPGYLTRLIGAPASAVTASITSGKQPGLDQCKRMKGRVKVFIFADYPEDLRGENRRFLSNML